MEFILSLPYPGDNSQTIRPGNVYDIERWRVWLAELGFDIESIFQVDFHPNSQCTLHRYRHNSEGRLFTWSNGEVATQDPVTVTYDTPPPVWT